MNKGILTVSFTLAKFRYLSKYKLRNFWKFLFSSVSSTNFANSFVKFRWNFDMKKKKKENTAPITVV
jgi:hypothetical protein